MPTKRRRAKAGSLVKITDSSTESSWIEGEVGNLFFLAKVFDDSSISGINNGRVSKLDIHRPSGKPWPFQCGESVVSYDRGWGKKPSKEYKPHYDAVMKLIQATPKKFS